MDSNKPPIPPASPQQQNDSPQKGPHPPQQPQTQPQPQPQPHPSNADILKDLVESILDSDTGRAIDLLEDLSNDDASADLAKYRVGNRNNAASSDALQAANDAPDCDVSLLQLACAYSFSAELISLLALRCPDLLLVRREFPYEGQTPVHTLVSKENVRAVDAVLTTQDMVSKAILLTTSTTTDAASPVNATVMLGGLPLSVAALTFNLDLVDLLLRHGACLTDSNDRGDTVFHSLARFSALYPEKEGRVVQVMAELHHRLKQKHEPRSVWLKENHEGATVLKMAAQTSEPQIFNFVLALKGVYCDLDEHDGLFDSLLYDITDIDPIAIKQVVETKKANSNRYNKVHALVNGLPESQMRNSVRASGGSKRSTSKRHGDASTATTGPDMAEMSVLEIIYQAEKVEDAFKILENPVVRRVIEEKWGRYSWLFVVWTALHVLTMLWITVYAEYKSRVMALSPPGVANDSAIYAAYYNSGTTRNVESKGRQFVNVTAILTSLWSLTLLLYEVVRLVQGRSLRRYVSNQLHHHNGFYRLQLIAFALTLLADAAVYAVWYRTGGAANSYCLIVALLVGWWFTTFFLRPWKKFSFFTVMLQEVLIGDMLRFSTIFIPMLIGFSTAMHITYLPTPGPLPEEFETIGKTVMTMFKLMLGLADVEVLYAAPEAWLAITLFVLYVLLTYSLMLNALIALMSNTCSIVSQNRDDQWKLQRLSIVLFLQESLWLCVCLQSTGQPRVIRLEDLHNKQTTTKTRFVIKMSSVRGGDGSAVVPSVVKSMAEGSDDDDDDDNGPTTVAKSEMFDLLAAMNFQRRQALARPDSEEQGGEGAPTESPCRPEDTGGGGESEKKTGDLALHLYKHQQSWSSTYVNIRQTLRGGPKSTGRGTPSSNPAGGGGRGPSLSRASSGRDFLDGKLQAVGSTLSRTLHNITEAFTEAEEASPAGARPPARPPGSRPMSAEKREKLRHRRGSAGGWRRRGERRQQQRQRRKESEGSGRSLELFVNPRPADEAAMIKSSQQTGHGIFQVDASRIHMHTPLQE